MESNFLQVKHSTADAAKTRSMLFINHAMPEDSDFARWLAIQLAAQGYTVWSEAAKLIGGERFWNDAEDAIRHHTLKLLAIVSRASRRKDGVQNEIDFARSIAKSLGVPTERFVQALLLDELEEHDLPIQLSGRNAILFAPSWAAGLAKLLKVLQRDDVPCQHQTTNAVGDWARDALSGGRRPIERDTQLVTNRLPVLAFPETIWFYEFAAPLNQNQQRALAKLIPWPAFVHHRLLGTFAQPHAVLTHLDPNFKASVRANIPTTDYLEHGSKDPAVDRRSARNHLTSMVREGWDALCLARGLGKMEGSSGRSCWFQRERGAGISTTAFRDVDGRARRKGLQGKKTRKVSETERVPVMHWHYAPSAKVFIGYQSEIMLMPHVAFTREGMTLIGDSDKAHRVRRSFCKSWFNEQWRTLQLAYLTVLQGDDSNLELPVGPGINVVVAARPDLFTARVWYDPPPPKSRSASMIKLPPSEAAVDEAVADEEGDIASEITDDWSDDEEDDT